MRALAPLAAIILALLPLAGCVDLAGLFGRDRAAAVAPAAGHEHPAPAGGLPADRPAAPPAPTGQPNSHEAAPSPTATTAPLAGQVPLPGTTRLAPAGASAPGAPLYLTEDTTWRGEVLVEGAVTVAPQATLTIEPGTVVRFRRTVAGADAGPLLLVEGRLVARGTADAPVRFTSVYPDPVAGEWGGIVFLGSEKKNSLEHCLIEGAVAGVDAAFSTVSLIGTDVASCGYGGRFRDCLLTISNGSVSGSGCGLELNDSEATLRDMQLQGNGRGIVARESSLRLEHMTITANRETGIAADGARLTLVESTVDRNGAGLVLTGCQGTVSGGRIADNRGNGVVLVRSRVRLTGNAITGNEVGLRVADGRGVAWGNVFSGNTRYDVYNDGADEFRAIANWWSTPGRIYDGRTDAGRGLVLTAPPLAAKPELPAMNSVAK